MSGNWALFRSAQQRCKGQLLGVMQMLLYGRSDAIDPKRS
jgi:hypothetical protein